MELDELDDKSIDYILENVTVERLTAWEHDFVESISDQWSRGRHLTDKQKLKLGEIWERQP